MDNTNLMSIFVSEGRNTACSPSISNQFGYNQSLLAVLQCPICTDYMYPPIRLCELGHSFCDSCYKQMNKCGTCRRELLKEARNYSLEDLHAKIQFPCQNREEGCPIIETGLKIHQHEKHCSFRKQPCPLKNVKNCIWMGQQKSWLNHCESKHPDDIYTTNSEKFSYPGFLTAFASTETCKIFVLLFHVHDEFFKCVWVHDCETGFVRWCVFSLSDQYPQEKFKFSINLIDDCGLVKLSLVGECQPLDELVDIEADCLVNNSDYLFLHSDMIKKYLNENGDMSYSIEIIKPL